MSLTQRLLLHAGALDDLAGRPTSLGRIDARCKLLVALAFVVVAASFGRVALLRPLPLVLFLAVCFALGDVPLGPVFRRVALLSPFALFVGAGDWIFHRAPALTLGSWTLSEGSVSFASLLLRFALCTTAVFLLAATTRFADIVEAMRRLGMPRVLATQLLLAHRYFFVLAEEAGRLARAHSLRSSNQAPGLGEGVTLLTQLLLRSLGRAERVHRAMSCRGFHGDLTVAPPRSIGGRDLAFLAGWVLFFALVRAVDVPGALGGALTP